jgi:hypothetical protein
VFPSFQDSFSWSASHLTWRGERVGHPLGGREIFLWVTSVFLMYPGQAEGQRLVWPSLANPEVQMTSVCSSILLRT